MNIQMIFNDLSSEEISENKYYAMEKMELFLKTYATAIKSGVSRDVILTQDLNYIKLAEAYFVYNWRNDIKVLQDKKNLYQLFNSFINRTQVINDIDTNDKDFTFKDGKNSKSLLKCYLDQNIALSLGTEQFSSSEIKGTYSFVDSNYKLVENEISVPNASMPEHLSEYKIKNLIEDYNKRYQLNLSNGVEFWERKGTAFPTLVFCENIKKQINSIEKILFIDVVKKIIRLEEYFSNWNWSNFECKNIPSTSPESEETLKAYERQHTFETPFGYNVIVSYHIKGALFNSRVYFHIDYSNKKVVICSVGEHLPCITYGAG